jgi:tripartite-type tricarboxylate transporter receptor subunit TctC
LTLFEPLADLKERETIMSHRLSGTSIAIAIVALLGACPAFGEPDYPAKPVRFVNPYPPGGGTDLVARSLARSFTEAWGKQVIVDNRPGGTGIIGALTVAKASPDGYTLLQGTSAVMVATPLVSSAPPYNPLRDFLSAGRTAVVPPILVANAALPANSMRELIALARKAPGTINFASPGFGSQHHLAIELLRSMAAIDVVHVPYKGGALAVTDTIAGSVQLTFTSIPSVQPHVKSGRLKALAVGSPKRSVVMPEVPTISESGVPGFNYQSWYGIFAPARTPRSVIDAINAQLRKTLASREIAQLLLAQGVEPSPSPPEELGAIIKEETALWGKIVKDRGIRVD